MPTYLCERAIEDALKYGRAILKYISPNDVGLTGGHQCGYYLPKSAWQLFTQHPPDKGQNYESEVSVLWADGRETASRVKWYGKGTRSEYRLTRFGKDFPHLTEDSVGDLLVLIPKSHREFNAYVLDIEEDIEQIKATLGVNITRSWAVYQPDAPEETEEECIERHFMQFARTLTAFPAGKVFSAEAQQALADCIAALKNHSPDRKLIEFMEAEFRLFRIAERIICQPEIVRPFKDIDDFLKTAKTITQRRVARAGRSLENHVEYILKESGIPHKMRPKIDGEPDVVIPSEEAYNDPTYPLDRLFIVGIKTTCKDRWRQVLNEGNRQPHKHLLTLQQGISGNQLQEMDKAGLTLVVPEKLHSLYPKKGHNAAILKVESFLGTVKAQLGV
jgi:EcoRII C terminal/Restriction endonuclease EcoRII, N-terminal